MICAISLPRLIWMSSSHPWPFYERFKTCIFSKSYIHELELGDSNRFVCRIDSEDRIETIKFRFATFKNAQLGLDFNVILKSCYILVALHFVFPFLVRNTCLYLVRFFVPPTNNSPIHSIQKLGLTIIAPLL